MKISIEIKDNKFHYDYDIGEHSRGHGDMELCADNLCWFTSILNGCHKHWFHENEDDMMRMRVFAHLEKHPEVIKEYIEAQKQRGIKIKI